MRKVKPEDEIPIWFIEPRYYHKRVARMEDAKLPRKVARELEKLHTWMESLNGKDVDSKVLLQRIYKVADLYMSEALADKIVCAKGCAYCCTRIQVEATLLEADYLAANTNHLVYNPWAKHSFQTGDVPEAPCPVLDTETGLCSSYENRPLQCRLFATIDSYDFCIDPQSSHYIHSPKSSGLWEWVLGVLTFLSMQQADKRSFTGVADMRDWFTKEDK